MIKRKISKELCFKLDCLSSPSVENKMIVKYLVRWENEITFLESLLKTMELTKDLTEIDNEFKYNSFIQDKIDFNQFLSGIVESDGFFKEMTELKNAAKVLQLTTINLSTEIKDAIKTFTKDIQINADINASIPVLTVTGSHIVLSKVISTIQWYLTNYSKIILIKFNAIVIHNDVGLSQELWNGKMIDVIARGIIIHNSIEWDVSGLNGITTSEDDSKIHGKKGGIVIIQADYIENSSFWIIKANGGNGRNGQEGGQITDGTDGEIVTYEEIVKVAKWVYDNCKDDKGTKDYYIGNIRCEYFCHSDGFTFSALTLCFGLPATDPKYETAVSKGNPGKAGIIIINAFNGASSVKTFSNPGPVTITNTIVKKTYIGLRGYDRGSYEQTARSPVFFSSTRYTKLHKTFLNHSCRYCVWNKQLDEYQQIVEV